MITIALPFSATVVSCVHSYTVTISSCYGFFEIGRGVDSAEILCHENILAIHCCPS